MLHFDSHLLLLYFPPFCFAFFQAKLLLWTNAMQAPESVTPLRFA